MDVYRTDEEQAEAVKQWWRDNGMSLVVGVAIGLIAIFGWRGWQNHTILQAEAASTLYQQMITASQEDDHENIRVYADRIIADHESTLYANFAGLMLAKLAAEESDLSQAETHLRWVLANNNQTEIEHITRLRLINILLADNRIDQALDMVNVSDKGKFIGRYEELRGDIFVKQGKLQEAQQAYEIALLNATAGSETQSLLQLKLDALGRI